MELVYEPHEVVLLSKVVATACAEVGCDDAARDVIAMRILSFADNGERDFETLLSAARYFGGETILPEASSFTRPSGGETSEVQPIP